MEHLYVYYENIITREINISKILDKNYIINSKETREKKRYKYILIL